MSWILWLLVVPVSGLVTGGVLRASGVPRRTAVLAGVAAGAVTAIALVALWLTAFGECLGENPDPAPPASWPWSPRHQFCNDPGSAASLGALALLLVPTIMVTLGTFLRLKRQPTLGWIAYATLLATPFLPSLYVASLPSYRLDSYPILHQPLLRPATGSRPARVCYVHGIAFGPRKTQITPATSRHCVELKRTRESVTLTPRYDEGRTSYDLEWMGKNLTKDGLPIRPGGTGVDGLLVERAYELPEDEAERDAWLVN